MHQSIPQSAGRDPLYYPPDTKWPLFATHLSSSLHLPNSAAVSFLHHPIGGHRCPVSSNPILKLVIRSFRQKRCTPPIILQILLDFMERPGCDSTATGSFLKPPCQFTISLAHPSATALPISLSVYAVHSTWG